MQLPHRLLHVLWVLSFISAKKAGCFRVNSCKCIMENGSGVINLKAMEDADGFLGRLKPVAAGSVVPVDTEVLLSFSPCQHFSLPDDFTGSDCTDVAACLIIYVTPTVETIRLSTGESSSLPYSLTSHNKLPMTVVHYHCLGGEPLCLSCAVGDLGVGTIFLIILSFSAAAYFLLGNGLSPISNPNLTTYKMFVWCMICYLFADRRPARRRDTDATDCTQDAEHCSSPRPGSILQCA
uniref:Uncharacterized protein n=1 Tax=Astatotilapia calliptera TaxID=8154 RepID=A0A3P8QDY5_ASTCA